MGPAALIDKSFLESLPGKLIYSLLERYCLCISPVLVMEMHGDLAKAPDLGDAPEDNVRILANKILGPGCYVCTHARKMMIVSLLGMEVDMTSGRVPMEGGKRVPGADGGFGVFFDIPPIMGVINQWKDGVASAAQKKVAEKYRRT